MSAKKTFNDLNTDDLRYLLIEKQNAEREARLEQFQRSGRIARSHATEAPIHAEMAELKQIPAPGLFSGHAKRTPRLLDRILLIVEVLAVAGLAYVLFNGAKILTQLNDEVVSVMNAPTATVLSENMAVVLPSGHTSPNSNEGAQPNMAEIPEHLRPVIQGLSGLPIPSPSPAHAIRIQIPSIKVDAPIVQGDDWEQLKKGVGQRIGTANPGEDGNVVLSAHNDIFGEIFRHLDQLKAGDEIILFTGTASFTYVVETTQIVEPTVVSVMAPTENPVVTLISCYPYLIDSKRIVVAATLKD